MCPTCRTALNVAKQPAGRRGARVHPQPHRAGQVQGADQGGAGGGVRPRPPSRYPRRRASTSRRRSSRSASASARSPLLVILLPRWRRRARSSAGPPAASGSRHLGGGLRAARRRAAPLRPMSRSWPAPTRPSSQPSPSACASFVSPCVLPLVPGYLSCGLRGEHRRDARAGAPGSGASCGRPPSSACRSRSIFVALGMTATGIGSHAAPTTADLLDQIAGCADHRAGRAVRPDARSSRAWQPRVAP